MLCWFHIFRLVSLFLVFVPFNPAQSCFLIYCECLFSSSLVCSGSSFLHHSVEFELPIDASLALGQRFACNLCIFVNVFQDVLLINVYREKRYNCIHTELSL